MGLVLACSGIKGLFWASPFSMIGFHWLPCAWCLCVFGVMPSCCVWLVFHCAGFAWRFVLSGMPCWEVLGGIVWFVAIGLVGGFCNTGPVVSGMGHLRNPHCLQRSVSLPGAIIMSLWHPPPWSCQLQLESGSLPPHTPDESWSSSYGVVVYDSVG